MAAVRARGILPSHGLLAVVGEQIVCVRDLDADQIQPSSVDLRLGARAFRVPASFLPGRGHTVADRLTQLSEGQIDLRSKTLLRKGEIYIVPLQESLALRHHVSGIANPKSSTGRLDVFTRLITDYGTEFDRIADGYKGPLYAEISPRSFDVIVDEGSRLLQVRLQIDAEAPTDQDIRDLHARGSLIPDEDELDIKNAGIAIRVDMCGEGSQGIVGYRARRETPAPIDFARIGEYDPSDYWDPLYASEKGGLVLEPDAFYILASKQSVCIPADVAGEMVAYDTLVGEFRVHYAGFFDPGFGLHRDGTRGTRAVLEVRSHEVPFLIEDGQIMGRIVYHKLTEAPKRLYGHDIGSNYAKQGLTLAKQFRPWKLEGR